MTSKAFMVAAALLLAVSSASAQDPTKRAGPTPAELFDRGMNQLSGANFNRSPLSATHALRRSADLGYAPAQVVLGYFSETGVVTTLDPGGAAEWYRKAADGGDRLGQWLLGRLYLTGQGVARDSALAERWLRQAAEQGDPFGQYLLATVYSERDYTKAPEWFRRAAEQGLPQAQYRFGLALARGCGVNVNKFEAYVWLLVSADAGNALAAQELQALEADLGTNQTEAAKTRARALEKSVSRSVVARGCTGWAGEFDEIPAPPPPGVQTFCR